MNNLISRREVLDEINNINASGGFATYNDYCALFDFVDTMPSAPDVTDNNAGDMISRQAAIEAVETFFKNYPKADKKIQLPSCSQVCDVLREIPSAQEWIPVIDPKTKKKRLPEIEHDCVGCVIVNAIYCYAGNYVVTTLRYVRKKLRNKLVERWEYMDGTIFHKSVLYWQPLPELPKWLPKPPKEKEV